MAATKVYANMLAVLDSSRLDGERLRRVAESETVADALKMLGDYGFPVCTDIDGFAVAAANELIEFVSEYAASKSVKDALLAPFWYNNVKLAYKSRYADVPRDGYYALEHEAEKIARGDYEDCDKYLLEALTSLDEADERDPQRIDLAITRAMYEFCLKCPVKRVRDYFGAEADMKNILTAARKRRLGLGGDEFVNGGKIKLEKLENAISSENFAECFVGTPYAEMAEAAEERGFSELWRFERDSDDYLLLLTDAAVADMSSYEPFLHHYTKTRVELKAVKTALVCIKTNARDEFYRRVSLG